MLPQIAYWRNVDRKLGHRWTDWMKEKTSKLDWLARKENWFWHVKDGLVESRTNKVTMWYNLFLLWNIIEIVNPNYLSNMFEVTLVRIILIHIFLFFYKYKLIDFEKYFKCNKKMQSIWRQMFIYNYPRALKLIIF